MRAGVPNRISRRGRERHPEHGPHGESTVPFRRFDLS